MRVRLTGGPMAWQFDVFDAETGVKLENVASVELKVDRLEPMCVVTLVAGLVVDATFDAEVEEIAIPKGEEG